MAQFTALVADKALQEVDFTGFRLTPVREMKKMYPISEGFPEQPWHSMDDEVEILNAQDEDALHKLHISAWKRPPSDLKYYSDKAFIYEVQGTWNELFLPDLQRYVKEYITSNQNVELLRFWASDYEEIQLLPEQTMVVQQLDLEDLTYIAKQSYLRVKFTE